MKVICTEILLEVPNGALGIPVRGSKAEVINKVRDRDHPNSGFLEFERVDGAKVSINLQRMRDAIAMTEIEAQVTDARLALPGQQGFQAPR